MRLTRLSLRNYRVFEDPVELELPPGLVGVYGPNGAGKSYLVESILWTLFGKSRTTNAEVRTSGVLADCVTEVEFEHEGHLYAVRRTITGANAQVRAEAHADRQQVAEGARDTGRYVRSILGMDDAAFRASVFAEQKQLAAFSRRTPADRQKLVLQLLGITAVDRARDDARKDARARVQEHERLRAFLPDLEEARAAAAVAAAAREETEARHGAAAAAEETAAAARAAAEARHGALDAVRQEHDQVVAEGRHRREAHDRAGARVGELDRELAALTETEAELARLAPVAAGVPEAEARLRTVAVDARRRADAVQVAAAEAEGRRVAAEAELARAREAQERSAALTGEADCPLCGQALGESWEQVRAHRDEEVAAAAARRAAAEGEKAARAAETETVRRAAADAERAVGEALAARQEAAEACQRLQGRLERAGTARRERDTEQAAVQTLAGELEALREKLRALAFDTEQLQQVVAARDQAIRHHEAARQAAETTRLEAERAKGAAEAQAQRVREAEAQHGRLAGLEDDARHLSRAADLVADFRNRLVGTVGPRLSVQAADLFAELTDHEYDRLEVDPETYEIKIHDAGVAYGMGRFSGSEEDLANLALRVAVSEHVRFQSGGQVGLLVLDEVFGPLDGDRKDRMLAALQRLQGRFRQVLVVTHDAEVKEQLPHAIAVVPRRRRRAGAELVTG